jgi:hypothetical protein
MKPGMLIRRKHGKEPVRLRQMGTGRSARHICEILDVYGNPVLADNGEVKTMTYTSYDLLEPWADFLRKHPTFLDDHKKAEEEKEALNNLTSVMEDNADQVSQLLAALGVESKVQGSGYWRHDGSASHVVTIVFPSQAIDILRDAVERKWGSVLSLGRDEPSDPLADQERA